MRGPLAKSTTASGAMMGMWSRVAPCPSMPCVCSDPPAMWEIVFEKKSFILHLPAKKRTDFRTPCAGQTCSWIYLAVFLLGGGFNERPSPAVTPRLALKRAVPACFNRPTPPSMFCAVKAFQRKGGKKLPANFYFLFLTAKHHRQLTEREHRVTRGTRDSGGGGECVRVCVGGVGKLCNFTASFHINIS